MVLVHSERTKPYSCRHSGARGARGKMSIPLLMQVVGILHLSAVCARAVAVAGAVLSPTAGAAAAATSTGRGGTVTSGAAAVVSSSVATAAGKSFTDVRTEERAQEARKAFVSSSSGSSSTGSSNSPASGRSRTATRPLLRTTSITREVYSGDRRRKSRVSRVATGAFVAPLGPSLSRSCCHRQQQRHPLPRGGGGAGGGGSVRRSRCSSRIAPAKPTTFSCGAVSEAGGADACVVAPSQKRPWSMSAAAAAVAAAEAMASLAGRVSSPLPSPGSYSGAGDFFSRSRPSLIGLRALATGAAGGIEPDRSRDRDRSNGSGGDDSGRSAAAVIVSTPVAAFQALLSLVRWVLTAGRSGMKRQEQAAATGAAAMERGRRRDGLQLFQWMWRPFAGLEGGSVASRNSGGQASKYRRPQATGVPKQRAMLQPLTTQQLQSRYPRPQSTAYPRPQSTAYPRPKVSPPSLLNLEADEPMEVLPPLKERMAMEETGVERAVTKDPLWSKILVWVLERAITNRAMLVEGLEVSVDARSNREAMSGLLQSVGITFNHLELENLQISGGARMNITNLDLKVMTLLWKRFGSFKKPFEIEGSYVLTSEDLSTSSIVRRLVTNMMNSTLRKLETLATEPLRKSSITITQVSAKRSRLVIEGEMAYDSAKVPFTYRTSIGVKGKGHVVYLKDAEVFWENIGGSLSLPLLPLETFDVDMGEGARIESIRIVNGQVALKARVVISPFPPLLVASVRKRAAFRFDVAERLSVTFGNLVQNMKILGLQVRPNQA
ncbi:unnamed protein product [Ectocarpus sp. CCAP 1310/34]|nr:unnamed protein product [Ectocarpus sp. CCAP 1310/34]